MCHVIFIQGKKVRQFLDNLFYNLIEIFVLARGVLLLASCRACRKLLFLFRACNLLALSARMRYHVHENPLIQRFPKENALKLSSSAHQRTDLFSELVLH